MAPTVSDPPNVSRPLSDHVRDFIQRSEMTLRALEDRCVDPVTGNQLNRTWLSSLAAGKTKKIPESWRLRALAAGIGTPVETLQRLTAEQWANLAPAEGPDVLHGGGDWLRRELSRRGLLEHGELSRLARDADLKLSVLSRAIDEGRPPEGDTLRRIGKVLGYSLGDMLVLAGIAEPEELVATHQAPRASAETDQPREAQGSSGDEHPEIDLESFVPETTAEKALMAIYQADKRERENRERALQNQLQGLSEKVARLAEGAPGSEPDDDDGNSHITQLGA